MVLENQDDLSSKVKKLKVNSNSSKDVDNIFQNMKNKNLNIYRNKRTKFENKLNGIYIQLTP